MATFTVDTVAVADTAARARTRIATIQTEVDGMQGDITTLQSSWSGAASESMAICASDWQVTQLQVQANLDQISLALDQAAVSYDDAETANAGRFGGGHRLSPTSPAHATRPVTRRWAAPLERDGPPS